MDFLANPATASHPHWVDQGIRLCVAFIGGLLVTIIYKRTRPATHVNPSFPPTLVLLAVLIGIVTQVIGDNVARAFSLVGALSIVRFRTVVRDTQDTAFVIFAVVMGMAAGAGSYPIAILGLLIGGMAAAVVRAKTDVTWADTESTLVVRIGLGADHNTLLGPTFEKNIESSEVVSVATVRQGAALDYSYRIRLKRGIHPATFVKELNQIDGVQNVELRRGELDSP